MSRDRLAYLIRFVLAASLALAATALATTARAALTEEEMFFKGVADVNEGPLHFLANPPTDPVHHHQNRIVIAESTLSDGWARLEQCHSDIDAVPSSQITYGTDRIRAIRVTRADNIGRAWVEGHTVQMENIAPRATLCIEAETRALEPDGPRGFQLRNGPYMRRFLDGYYPMRVSMTVRFPERWLRYRDIDPAPQPGFNVRATASEISIETVFEGSLRTAIRFERVAAP